MSRNIVVRLNLPNMAYSGGDRLAIYAAAQEGLATLEADPEQGNRIYPRGWRPRSEAR